MASEPLEIAGRTFSDSLEQETEGSKMQSYSLKFCYLRLDPRKKSSLSEVFSDLFSHIQYTNHSKRQGEGVTSIEALRTPSRIDQSTQFCCSVLSGFLLPVCRRAQEVGEFVPAFTFTLQHSATTKLHYLKSNHENEAKK